VTANGVPGFALKYTYVLGDERLTAVALFLFKDRREYQVTAQAANAEWKDLRADLEAALESFRVD
jgi:hypothetical protein